MHPVVHLDYNTAFLDAIHGFLHYNCLLIIASYPSISWKPFSRFSRRNNNFKFSKRRIFSPPPMLEEIQLQFVSFINRHPEFCGQSDFFNLRGNKGTNVIRGTIILSCSFFPDHQELSFENNLYQINP